MHMLDVITSFTYFTGSKVGPSHIKIMQKIVLFIEPAEAAWSTPSKIGNSFMNRVGIEEDAKHEILKIHHLENNLYDFSRRMLSSEEGLDLINYTIISCES